MEKPKNILQQKLDAFIDKYYQNQLYKGLILGLSISLLALFAIAALEFIGRFNGQTRLVLFSVYVAGVLFILFWYVARPLIGLFKFNRKLDYTGAAKLIGSHFPEVQDKLTNALQLQARKDQSNDLLLASIAQRTKDLSPIPFSNAINFKANIKYVKFALLPALALIAVLLISPGFKSSTERVVRFNESFEIPAPFEFVVQEDQLTALQNQSVGIDLVLQGNQIPEDAYILYNDLRFKMLGGESGGFQFTIPNVQHDMVLQFEAGGFQSDENQLTVLKKPSLLSFNALLEFPAYIKRAPQSIQEFGEIIVPQGTKISWEFNTKNADLLMLTPQQTTLKQSKNKAHYQKRFLQSEQFGIKTSNEAVQQGDSLLYDIKVVPDAFPLIGLSTLHDSLSNKILYFTGDIKDDYGFSKLEFHYTFESGEQSGKQVKLSLPIDKALDIQSYYHLWNLNELNIQTEDEISYFFRVWDNDGIQGAKYTDTKTQYYSAPSELEIKQQTEELNQEIKQNLGSSKAEAEQMEKAIEEAERMLTENKQLDWQEKQKIEELLQKQEKLQKQIEETMQQNLEKNFKEEEFHKLSEKLQDKQEKLEELFNEVMDDEMKELMEKIRELMKENRTEELQKKLEEFKLSEIELNKELDRMLELFKELELEKMLEETIHQLNELAKEQNELAEKMKNNKASPQDLKKQEDIKQKMEELSKDLKKIEEKNSELESPKDIKSPEEKASETKQEMDKAGDQMKKGKNGKASKHQKNAAEKMKEMADELQEQMDEAYAEQHEEDYNTLRQILENLIQLSFDQEKVQSGFKENRNYSARYIELGQEQRRIKDESRLVEDSLIALSKRAIEVEHFINEEIAKINQHLDKSLAELGERQTNKALVHQQHIMTGYNNLALMLSESLKNMQEQMKADQENKGKPKAQCKKPGGSKGKKGKKPNMQAIKKMQQELAKQMEEMQKGKQQGKQPGSQEFGEMAAKQAAIRKQLRDLQRRLQKEGKGGSLGDLKKTQDMMDEVEKELYYKRLDQSTLQRLKQIEIKLSEHERAEQEREQDNKRSSEEGDDLVPKIPPALQEYLDQKAKEQELLKEISPQLTPYYEEKVKGYFEQP